MKIIVSYIPIVLMLFTGCKKGNDTVNAAVETVPITVEFDNIVDGQNLFLNAVNYSNGAGERFTVSMLQYFISNIRLRKTDGSWFTVPQDSSYFLIKESDPLTRYARFSAPPGDYDMLSFIVGVDSLRSTMDISKRTGVLDPTTGTDDAMYWTWNSGYIFFKMEGTSTAAPIDPTGQQKYRYHIGGFGGYSAPTFNNIKTVTLDLTAAGISQARKGRRTNIHLMVDIMKLFNGPTILSIASNPAVMFSDYSVNVANNYASMFIHSHTEN